MPGCTHYLLRDGVKNGRLLLDNPPKRRYAYSRRRYGGKARNHYIISCIHLLSTTQVILPPKAKEFDRAMRAELCRDPSWQ